VPSILPDTPQFAVPVYGTIFAERSLAVQRLQGGDQLILVPDPPGIDEPIEADTDGERAMARVVEQPKVWVHATGGDVLGHLSPDINGWLVPRMLAGARYAATVRSVGAPGEASWKRLVIDVRRLE